MCFSQGVECESGDELTTTGLEICLQGTEHLLLCGHHSPGLASILFVILTTHAILPHNDSFPLLTAAFIHFWEIRSTQNNVLEEIQRLDFNVNVGAQLTFTPPLQLGFIFCLDLQFYDLDQARYRVQEMISRWRFWCVSKDSDGYSDIGEGFEFDAISVTNTLFEALRLESSICKRRPVEPGLASSSAG